MSDMSDFDIAIVEKMLQARIMIALETDTDNPVYEDHQTNIIRNLLASLESAGRIKRNQEGGLQDWQR